MPERSSSGSRILRRTSGSIRNKSASGQDSSGSHIKRQSSKEVKLYRAKSYDQLEHQKSVPDLELSRLNKSYPRRSTSARTVKTPRTSRGSRIHRPTSPPELPPPPKPNEVTISFKHDPITLHEPLGKGGSGSVYRGSIQGLSLAVKKINLVSLPNEDQIQLDEYRGILLNTEHPNLIKCLGYQVIAQQIYLLFNLYSGSLRSILDQHQTKPVPASTVDHYLLEIIKGVDYLHSFPGIPSLGIKGPIIHRDLKSENVLTETILGNPLPRLIIADLEEAIMINGQTNLPSNIGTLEFMAPEVITQSRQMVSYDQQTDIYSFGMIIYEILTRKMPYHQDSTPPKAYQMIDLVSDGPPELQLSNPDYQKYITLYQQCTQSNPRKRPNSSTILERLPS